MNRPNSEQSRVPTAILRRLGLTDPSACALEDEALAKAFVDFARCLSSLGSARNVIIACDPEFFSFGQEIEAGRLRLLAGLLHPDPELVESVRERTYAVDGFQCAIGNFKGHVYDLSVAQALREFERFPGTSDGQRLVGDRPVTGHIDRVTALTTTGPGFCWRSELEVREFNEDCAIVLEYVDAEGDRSDAFPLVRGFVGRSDLFRNAGLLIAHECERGVPACSEVTGNSWLGACWKGNTLDEFSWGTKLLSAPDAVLADIEREYGGLDSIELWDDLTQLQQLCDELEFDDIGESEAPLDAETLRALEPTRKLCREILEKGSTPAWDALFEGLFQAWVRDYRAGVLTGWIRDLEILLGDESAGR